MDALKLRVIAKVDEVYRLLQIISSTLDYWCYWKLDSSRAQTRRYVTGSVTISFTTKGAQPVQSTEETGHFGSVNHPVVS